MRIGKFTGLKDSTVLSLALIILAGLSLRVYFLLSSDNFCGILPAQRILYSQALQFKLSDAGIVDPLIPVFYPYLLKVWIDIFGNILVSPRILSLILGTLTLLPFFLLVKILKGELTALFATLLLAVFPVHVIYSTLSLEEPVFYFIVFPALYLFLKDWLEPPARPRLVLSAILLSCSFGFRFEGILYSLVLGSLLLARKDKSDAVIFWAASLFLPVLWMAFCWLRFKNPAVSYTWHAFYSQFNREQGCGPGCVIEKITRVFSLPLLLAGAWGFFVSLKDKRMLIPNAVFSAFLAAFTVKILTGTLSWDVKYLLTFGMLFLVYEAVGIVYFFDNLRDKVPRAVFLGLFCLYATLFGAKYVLNPETANKAYKLTPEIREIVGYLAGVGRDENVLVDTDHMNFYPENIILFSGSDPGRFQIAREFEVFGHRMKDDRDIDSYRDYLMGLIDSRRFGYIIYAPQGRSLKLLLSMDGDKVRIGATEYKRLFAGSTYWLYKLEDKR